jgi:hypothetical protein
MNWCLLRGCDGDEAGESADVLEQEVIVARKEIKAVAQMGSTREEIIGSGGGPLP